jgi:Ca-activated chloride channel family protein
MRHLSSIVLALFALGGLMAPGAQQQEPFRVEVDVSLITLDVMVSDSTGRPVTTLEREDFEVLEDGVPQVIGSFAPVDSPYSVLVLFDCSDSTEPNWRFLAESMSRFFARLRPQDNISVAQFGGGYKLLLDWKPRGTGGMDIRVDSQDYTCNRTDFYGAVNKALTSLRKNTGRRGAIILTDGDHNGIPLERIDGSPSGGRKVDFERDPDFQKLLRTVRSSDSVLYFVAVNTDLNPSGLPGSRGRFNPEVIYDMLQVRSRLEQLAEVSGGRVSYPKEPGDVVPMFEQIGRDLGTSYGLGYSSSNKTKEAGYRKIEVRLRDKSLQVRQSRAGYQTQ